MTAEFNFLSETFSEKEAAEAIGLKPLTLRNYRLHGIGPRFVKVSAKSIRYWPADLKAWLDARTQTPKPMRASLGDTK